MKPEEDERSECKPDAKRKRDSAQPQEGAQPSREVKSCCARLYESDFVRLLLGESFHPGGLKLTSRLGELLKIAPHSRVLDVACGKGASALHLASTFGCQVVGLDYGEGNVQQAIESARERGIGGRAQFQCGDSERLPFDDASFDAIICECAFCTFPNKTTAACEFVRVLKPGGRAGVSDITRAPGLPPELQTLLAWVACIADARPAREYAQLLTDAGLQLDCVENHDDALRDMVHKMRMKLLGLEVAIGLEKLKLPGVNLTAAKELAANALQAISQQQLGYAIVTAIKPAR